MRLLLRHRAALTCWNVALTWLRMSSFCDSLSLEPKRCMNLSGCHRMASFLKSFCPTWKTEPSRGNGMSSKLISPSLPAFSSNASHSASLWPEVTELDPNRANRDGDVGLPPPPSKLAPVLNLYLNSSWALSFPSREKPNLA